MPLPLTTLSDYQEGRFRLPLDKISTKDFLADLKDYEEKILNDLLGDDLADLFISDLDGNNEPQEQRFKNIFGKVVYSTICESEIYRSYGLKKLIQGFVYFKYIREIHAQKTVVGNKKADSENSVNVGMSAGTSVIKYNESVDAYEAVQGFICENAEIYPEFKGVYKNYNSNL